MKERLKALDFAMKMELVGLETYLDLARETNDVSGKNMLVSLARDELTHFTMLEAAERSGGAGDFTIERSEAERLAPRVSDVERGVGKSGLNQIHSLRIALAQEAKSIEFYREAGAEPPDSLKRLFERLVEMEEAHATLIRAQLDFINETGFWFDIPEFNVEE